MESDQIARGEDALGEKLIHEYAVPCLEQPCRKIFLSREHAERAAAKEGGVIEQRLVTPWRPA